MRRNAAQDDGSNGVTWTCHFRRLALSRSGMEVDRTTRELMKEKEKEMENVIRSIES